MWNWIIKNKWKLLLALVAFAAGVAANIYANRMSEQKIIAAITEQINELKDKRLTEEGQRQLIELEAQLKLLKK